MRPSFIGSIQSDTLYEKHGVYFFGVPYEIYATRLKPSDKTCGECGGFLSLIGAETREQLEAIIQKYIVKVHSRLKYACKSCQATVKLAPAPHEAMEKGIAGPYYEPIKSDQKNEMTSNSLV